jgi:hypothetical protein
MGSPRLGLPMLSSGKNMAHRKLAEIDFFRIDQYVGK